MKKTLLLAAFAFAGAFAFAQKPAAGSKTAEVNLNFQTGTAPIGYNLPGELRLRYFLSDNAAVRVRLGLGSMSETEKVAAPAPGTEVAEVKTNYGFGLSLSPGYEMHFEGTSKLSPYWGGQLTIAIQGGKTIDVSNANVANPAPGQVVANNKYSEKAGGTTTFGLSVFMGTDYYIADNVFIGGEFGLGLFSSTSVGDGETTVTTGGNTTTGKTLGTSSMSLFGVTTGGVRLGFVF